MSRKAIIFGIKGIKLSYQEKIFFKKNKPWGIILFSRNIRNINQLKMLTSQIRKLFNDKYYPIIIDQEGGNVSRLNKIIDLSFFSQRVFSSLYKSNKKLFLIFYEIYINKVCDLLNNVGININTVPVLDVIRKNSHSIIGSRSFSSNACLVTKLGKLCISIYEKNKIAPVMKHIPGHGLSTVDSHFKVPRVNESIKNLKRKDFLPFKKCKTNFAMTAHVIYSSYDLKNTATHSKKIINTVIRKYIKFNGILISDDISMKALKYDLTENAIIALKSGCNLVLHCNGNFKEMSKLAKVVPKIDTFTKKKTSHFLKFLR